MTSSACCKIIFVILFVLTPSNQATELTDYHDYNHNLADVTLFIIREHLSVRTPTFILAEHSTSLETKNTNMDLLNHLLHNLRYDISVQLKFDEHWNYFMFIVDSFDAFRILYLQIPESRPYRSFYFLIILTKKTADWKNTMDQIFNDCFANNVLNVNIIVEHTKNITMYTYMLFLKNSCRRVKSTILFSFNQNYKKLKEIFPDKLNKFHGCPLKFSVGIGCIAPFFIFEGNKSDPKPIGDWENMSGLEGKLLKYLSRSLNFTIELLPFPKDRNFIEKGISYGSYAELNSGKADIALGGYNNADPMSLFSHSDMYSGSHLRQVVRGKTLSPLNRLMRPFSNHLWLLVGAFVLSGSICIFILKFMNPSIGHFILGKRSKSAVLNFLSLLIGNAVTRVPRRNFARFLLMMFLLLDLVLRSAYLGSLYESILSSKTYAKLPSGFDQLVEEGYIFLLPKDTAHLKVYLSYPKVNIIIVNDPLEKRLEKLKQENGNYVTIVLQKNFEHYKLEARKHNQENDLLLIDEVLIMFPMQLILVKNSVFLDVFNNVLQKFSSSGVLSKLKKDMDFDLDIKKYSTQLKVKLTIHHLQGIFNIFLYFNFIAIAVFGLEILSNYFGRLRSVLDWMN